MSLVIDASYTIAMVLEEGGLCDVDEVAGSINGGAAVVPSLWRFEVANSLLMAVKRGRIDASRSSEIFTELDATRISDDIGVARVWRVTYALAERHALTVYDAAYLELAMRLGARLASLDRRLAAAARLEGVTVLGSPAP